MEESANQGIEDDEDDEETPASRFTAFLLNFLIDGFVSRDKNVRYRVLYTLQGMITYLGEIEYVDHIRYSVFYQTDNMSLGQKPTLLFRTLF